MSKIDEDEIRRRLKLLSQIEPTPEAAHRAIERVRDTLVSKEKRRESTGTRIWRAIIKRPITQLAAAAVIIVAIGLFIAHRGPGDQPSAPKVSQVAKSPAEMMTAISLTMAYRRGGIEAVEEQCEKAFEMLGPRPGRITIQEILAELNGT